jgi:Uma2 family endonuclease
VIAGVTELAFCSAVPLSSRRGGRDVATVPTARATIDDLYRVDGKAELIGGRIVRFPPAGQLPSEVAGEIYVSLRQHARSLGQGKVYTGGIGFAVPELTSGRESFSPDASYDVGTDPPNRMRFVEHAPTFAVEVRSESDYGPAADKEYADKRADYFEAGTLVVWDVDPVAETITGYRPGQQPVVFRRGDEADAEPAVPGWRIDVDEVFDV